MIEALACGLPVAAFPVAGPLDIVGARGRGPDDSLPMTVGALGEDLGEAIARALTCDPLGAAVHGASFSWERATDQFEAALRDAGELRVAPAVANVPIPA
jgi:glycosyltransferase involved in cell wall biosynthesis